MTFLLCLVAYLAPAQEFRATISGHVLDGTGAAVPQAKIQAINVDTKEVSNANTDSSGSYTIPLLRPGQYKVTVAATGFKQYVLDNVTLQIGQTAGIDATLTL